MESTTLLSPLINFLRRRLAGPPVVKEMIGQTRRYLINTFARYTYAPTLDWNRTDYAFWDRLRHSREVGYELGALFLKPLASKIAGWVLGRAPTWELENSDLSKALNEWWGGHHAQILFACEESVSLADFFVVINADLSVALIQPDVAYPIVDERNFTKIVGWELIQQVPHPVRAGEIMTLVDQFYPDRRVRIVKRNGIVQSEETYTNLLAQIEPGLLPVVHIPNGAGSNERFGRPEAEALLPVIHRYSEVFQAAIEGNLRQGRPTPVVSNMGTPQDVDAFWERYGSRQDITLPDGTIETVQTLEFDGDKMLTLSGTATFAYVGPNTFTGDTQVLLGLLFYLLLQHSEIPEFAWGNAITSSHASADTQLDPFIKWIEKRRGLAAYWLIRIATIAAGYISLANPNMRMNDRPQLSWQPLTEKDGNLTLSTLTWALQNGLLTKETALRLAPIDVPEVEKEIEKAAKEGEAKRKADIQPIPLPQQQQNNTQQQNNVPPQQQDNQPQQTQTKVA